MVFSRASKKKPEARGRADAAAVASQPLWLFAGRRVGHRGDVRTGNGAELSGRVGGGDSPQATGSFPLLSHPSFEV